MPQVAATNAGLILNAVASVIVAIAAMTLAFFLLRRWRQLGATMHAYALFWVVTALVWIPLSLRYITIILNGPASLAHLFDVALQASIFFNGPPLFYYIIKRLTDKRDLARGVALLSGVLAIAAIWYVAQPNGLIQKSPTFFSNETDVNASSLLIFGVQSACMFMLLIYDFGRQLYRYFFGQIKIFYEVLYPLPILIYLVFGSIEQAGLIKDWFIVVFRVLYAVSFLFVFALMTNHEAATEPYIFNRREWAGLQHK